VCRVAHRRYSTPLHFTTHTHPTYAHTTQIRTLCLSPDGQLLLSIDEAGRALLIARQRRVLLHHFSFKGPVAAAAFSPDGRHVAVAVGRLLQVRAGSGEREREGGGRQTHASVAVTLPLCFSAQHTTSPPQLKGHRH
jgi:WD40 repeat protein